jgi:hypothetical protein
MLSQVYHLDRETYSGFSIRVLLYMMSARWPKVVSKQRVNERSNDRAPGKSRTSGSRGGDEERRKRMLQRPGKVWLDEFLFAQSQQLSRLFIITTLFFLPAEKLPLGRARARSLSRILYRKYAECHRTMALVFSPVGFLESAVW